MFHSAFSAENRWDYQGDGMFRIGKKLMASAALVAAIAASPLAAQTAVTVGATVKDPQGGVVGTVSSVTDAAVMVKTDKHEIGLPPASFAKGPDGYLISMTQVQLNDAYEQAMAKAAETVKVGAVVKGKEGNPAGTITELDDQFVTIQLTGTESKVRLARNAVAGTPDGPIIGLTADELKAQAGATAPSGK
jgi:preprotein translocase subunit YajC